MKKQLGFSLFEVMIALSLLLIIITLTTVSTRFFHRSMVSAQIDLLHNTCYYLQQYAIATNTIQELTFNCQDHSYCYHDHTYKLPTSVAFGMRNDAKGPPSAPYAFISKPITFVENKILFYPDGIISAGTVYLVSADKTHLYALSNGISAVSYLRKYYYDGSWHLA